MKRAALFAIIIAVLVAIGVALQHRGSTPNVATTAAVESHDTGAAVATTSSATPPVTAPDEDASPTPAASRQPHFVDAVAPSQIRAGDQDRDLQLTKRSIADFRRALHENPVGNNAEITRKLLGRNARQSRFLGADVKLNDKGELLDAFGSPLFFHQISATQMEIRSAGPDHMLWTADDEVAR